MRRLACVVLATAWVVSADQRSMAWGADGHRVVARVAHALLTQAARRSVSDLLTGRDLVSVATWADGVAAARPATFRRHFVRIPVGAETYQPARDCARTEQGDCVVAGVSNAIRAFVLAKRGLVGEPDRQEALKFLVHFVGDVHQPLNCVDNHDQGGRDVKISASGALAGVADLYTVWDSALISSRGMSEEEYAADLLRLLATRPVARSAQDPAAWALECHTLAVKHAYQYPGFRVGARPAHPVILDATYIINAQAVIDRQLQVAGVRLADTLNSLLVDVPQSKETSRSTGPVRPSAF